MPNASLDKFLFGKFLKKLQNIFYYYLNVKDQFLYVIRLSYLGFNTFLKLSYLIETKPSLSGLIGTKLKYKLPN